MTLTGTVEALKQQNHSDLRGIQYKNMRSMEDVVIADRQ
jgi:hypothetical protein